MTAVESVADRKPLANVLRVFEFIHKSNGIVFRGNAAALLIGNQRVFAKPEFASTLSGLNKRRRTEVSPIEIGIAKHFKRVSVSKSNLFILGWKIRGIDKPYIRRPRTSCPRHRLR